MLACLPTYLPMDYCLSSLILVSMFCVSVSASCNCNLHSMAMAFGVSMYYKIIFSFVFTPLPLYQYHYTIYHYLKRPSNQDPENNQCSTLYSV